MTKLFNFDINDKNPVEQTTIGFLPRKVIIPFSQETNFECRNVVNKGETVREGQVIAEVSRDVYGIKSFGVTKIHSPLPGKVLGIINCSFPNGKHGKAIEILLEGSFTHIGKEHRLYEWKNYSPAMLLRSVSESGVINTFSNNYFSSFELEINKLRDISEKKVFVRLFDEDPTCKIDSSLVRSELKKIIYGIFIVSKICEAEEIIISYSTQINLETMLSDELKEIIASLPVKFMPVDTRVYPVGGKQELVDSYIKMTKSSQDRDNIEKATLFVDSNTLIHVYNAVVLNIPVEYVNIYVDGDCLQAKALLKVPVGTLLKDIANQCGGFVKNVNKIIINGNIKGVSINNMNTPITKYVKSVTFSSEKTNFASDFGICIHCGKCRSVCKSNLCPDLIYSSVMDLAAIEQIYIDSAVLCSDCEVCSFVCPSKLPLSKVIKLVKDER